MNFQIRQAITANMKNNSATDIKGIVDDAIQRGEEQLLPGLGVFFEQLWNRADEQEREKISGEIAQAFSGQ
ncbi:small acid-soluble spore protein SspI [Sporosarcina sp. Te-1]|uniref:small acid-soluble spore protein SspI n=1 Tax=Sporosarcina sp. Te-1 TaxID=2818390 RepID=UPI001A9DB617|nr:small acid-soluble spore protein SspI [Sporosarcina sp. Te-1]QTD41488.1 small acid-soluble spore protein SspI [Sporosarcina sp. Te-1]